MLDRQDMTAISFYSDPCPRIQAGSLFSLEKEIQMLKRLVIIPLLLLLCPIFTFAHPGHGETGGYTIIHYFVEWNHAIITWPLLVAGVVFLRIRAGKKKADA